MRQNTAVRQLTARVATLEGELKSAREATNVVAAQRDRESDRANRVERILNEVLGALAMLTNGGQAQYDAANEASYDAKVKEILKGPRG